MKLTVWNLVALGLALAAVFVPSRSHAGDPFDMKCSRDLTAWGEPTMKRCENEEVVCYRTYSSAGVALSCNWKRQK